MIGLGALGMAALGGLLFLIFVGNEGVPCLRVLVPRYYPEDHP